MGLGSNDSGSVNSVAPSRHSGAELGNEGQKEGTDTVTGNSGGRGGHSINRSQHLNV